MKSLVGDIHQDCGGFVGSYRALCDFYNIPVCEDIAFDIDNLYVFNDITEFNLSHLQMRLGNEFSRKFSF